MDGFHDQLTEFEFIEGRQMLKGLTSRFTAKHWGFKVSDSQAVDDPLQSIEIQLLSMLEGKRSDDPNVLGWWCTFHNLDRTRILAKLQRGGYLAPAGYEVAVRKATVPVLKTFLQAHHLSINGKKDELVKRIVENVNQDECRQYFTTGYWAMTPKAIDLIRLEEAKSQTEHRQNVEFIRAGNYEALKRRIYPNKTEHWGTEDTFHETIEFLMKHAFEGFGLSEDIRREASSVVAARAIDYSVRGYSTCVEEVLSNLREVTLSPESLRLPESLITYANENAIESRSDVLEVYILFIISRARAAAELANYKRLGFKKIKIDSAACNRCRRPAEGRSYRIDEVPLLPLDWNCGCIYLLP